MAPARKAQPKTLAQMAAAAKQPERSRMRFTHVRNATEPAIRIESPTDSPVYVSVTVTVAELARFLWSTVDENGRTT